MFSLPNVSRLLAVSQVIPNQQRRVCKLVVIKRQSACAHNRVFNAPRFSLKKNLLQFVGTEVLGSFCHFCCSHQTSTHSSLIHALLHALTTDAVTQHISCFFCKKLSCFIIKHFIGTLIRLVSPLCHMLVIN